MKFLNFITLKDYGKNLLTDSGSFYLKAISFIIVLAATAEGLAWGYFGSTFTPHNPWIGGVLVGLFIFSLFYFFDRSLITSDLLKYEHEKTLSGEDYKKPNLFSWQGIIFFITLYFKLAMRLFIVGLSLYLTAPFLTQFVFKTDIEHKMQEEYRNQIELAKQKKLSELQQEITQLNDSVEERRKDLDLEIGGERGTGYGRGDRANNIQAEIDEKNNIIKTKQKERALIEKNIDDAIKNNDPDELKTYGIIIPKDSNLFRAKAVESFEQESAFYTVNWTVKGFLAIIGLILILSKIMQPHAINLYFSNRLQEKWKRYESGMYDEYLPYEEKSTFALAHHQTTPEEFEKIMIRYAKDENRRFEKHQEKLLQKEAFEDEKRRKILEEERRQFDKHQQELLEVEIFEDEKRHKTLEEERRQFDKHQQELLEAEGFEDEKRRKEFDEKRRQFEKNQQALLQSEQLEQHLKHSEQEYRLRVAREKAKEEFIEKQKAFYQSQIEQSLVKVNQFEQDYLDKFQDEIDRLKRQEYALMSKIYEEERDFKNHEKIRADKQEKLDVVQEELKLMQEYLHREQDHYKHIESFQTMMQIESYIISHKKLMYSYQQELLEFDTNLRYHSENIQRLKQDLNKTQQHLAVLQRPLDEIKVIRTEIETQKMMKCRDQAFIDSPYEPIQEVEIDYLVQRFKQNEIDDQYHKPIAPSLHPSESVLKDTHAVDQSVSSPQIGKILDSQIVNNIDDFLSELKKISAPYTQNHTMSHQTKQSHD